MRTTTYSPNIHPPTMSTTPRLIFREATTSDDLLQICALNHQTFAEELGQHPTNSSGLLVDRFHDCNRYFIAVQGAEVVGMISAHPGPEYSVSQKLKDPHMLGQFPSALEVRLLAIAPHVRNRTVLAGLFWMVYDHALANGHTHLLISGIVDREAMYRKLGFLPLGPAVQVGAASFIPMVMEVRDGFAHPAKKAPAFQRYWERRQAQSKRPLLLLPGPVEVHPSVENAFKQDVISHRSQAFVSMFEETRSLLRSLAPGMDVTIFPGSGTLANDAVAANLKAVFGDARGLVISNGEFGERLAHQAVSAGLAFQHLQFQWGRPWDQAQLRASLNASPAWIWAVHLETSTGVLNDAGSLLTLASQHRAVVALDCVSSLGAVPLPAAGSALHFMTGVSGKAIGSYAGLAFVYLSDAAKALLKGKRLCPSFDLARMVETIGPCTTVPSPLLLALREALRQHYISPERQVARFRCYQSLGALVRHELVAAGLVPLSGERDAAPTISTFALPQDDFVSLCLSAGYRIAHESSYLQAHGWAQIANMGEVSLNSLDGLLGLLQSRRHSTADIAVGRGATQI